MRIMIKDAFEKKKKEKLDALFNYIRDIKIFKTKKKNNNVWI